MDKAILDTSTLIDIRKAAKRPRAEWSQNTLLNLLQYQSAYPKLTVSAFTIFEMLDGIHRAGYADSLRTFTETVFPTLEVIYPDQEIIAIGAEINASLAKGQSVGVVDALIAATAIRQTLVLVSANTEHFSRIQAAGFPLTLLDWRQPS